MEQVASSLDAPAWDAIYSDFQSMVEARPNNAWGYFRMGYATLGRDMNLMATIKYVSAPSGACPCFQRLKASPSLVLRLQSWTKFSR